MSKEISVTSVSSLKPNFICDDADLAIYNGKSFYQFYKTSLIEQTLSVLTPNVVNSLPLSFHGISSLESAEQWLLTQFSECELLAIANPHTKTLMGFIFVYEDEAEQPANSQSRHIGYLLAEHAWGKGIATKVLSGYLTHCKESGFKGVIYAGVEPDNIASIKVLEKLGFVEFSHEFPNGQVDIREEVQEEQNHDEQKQGEQQSQASLFYRRQL